MTIRTTLMRSLTAIALLAFLFVAIVLSTSLYTQLVTERFAAEEAAPAETTFVDVQGERIATRTWVGSDDITVVMVGGLSAWGGTWERTVAEQRERGSTHTFVVIDLPPFGYSIPSATANYSRVAQAGRITGVINQLTGQQFILLGHSYGGGPLAEAALTNPERVEKLILISPVLNIGAAPRVQPSGIVASDFVRETAVSVVTRIKPLLLRQLRSFVYVQDNITYDLLDLYTAPFSVDGTSKKLSLWLYTYLADDVGATRSAHAEQFSTTPFTTTLLWGTEDTLTPISESDALTAVGVQLIPLPAMGHIPMIEDIERFNDVLAEHLT